MSFLIDRDTCEAAVRGLGPVLSRFHRNAGSLHNSAVTVMALELWLLRPRTPARYLQTFAALSRQVKVVNVDEAVAHRAALLGASLSGHRPRLSSIDLLVVATAVVHNLTLVTHDVAHYAPVPGLTVADWRVP